MRHLYFLCIFSLVTQHHSAYLIVLEKHGLLFLALVKGGGYDKGTIQTALTDVYGHELGAVLDSGVHLFLKEIHPVVLACLLQRRQVVLRP